MYTLKKSLGQHFLKDENICKKIVSALDEHSFKNLVEIGPGGGAITKYLKEIEDIEFKAIELDKEKVDYLEKVYPELKDRIINESILDTGKPFEEEFNVIGNFPYNISSQILFKILEWKDSVPVVIGMFQKEVALRIAANPGNKTYGILSVLVQAFYKVEYLFDVHENCFTPPPKVKSGVIKMIRRSDTPSFDSERKFINLVKTAFNQRRKTMRNAVKSLFDPEVLADPIFEKRAEALSVDDFAALTKRMR